MFGDKIKNGLDLLTKATKMIEEGIQTNQAEIEKNNRQIEVLADKNKEMEVSGTKAQKIVDNFKKNILGE